MIAPGIERHFHSSRIPAVIALRGDAIVAVGYQIVFLAFRENRQAASIIEVRPTRTSFRPIPMASSLTECFRAGVLMILSS